MRNLAENHQTELDAAMRLIALLRPMIEHRIRPVSLEQCLSLRKSLIVAENLLSNPTLSDLERIQVAFQELESSAFFLSTWRMVINRTREFSQPSSLGMVLGMILEVIQQRVKNRAA